MNKLLKYIGAGAVALSVASCGDFLEQYSQDLVVAKNVSDLNELLIGDVYIKSYTIGDGASQGPLGFLNILDDDINTVGTSRKGNVASTAWNAVLKPMYGYFAWQQDVRYNYGRTWNSEDNQTWNLLYTRIAHANSIIDIIDEMPRNTEDDKVLYHRVRGEAHFARAQFYFYLANLYGRAYRPDSAATDLCVPLKTDPSVVHNKDNDTQFKRNSVKEVYDQIVADLTVAEQELTTSTQPERYRLHRASAEAAGLLLSRTYLYMQEWAKAEAAAKRVIDSKNFAMATLSDIAANEAFLTRSNTQEIIFSQGANHITVKSPSLPVSISGSEADYCVTRDLYDLYQDEDVRKGKFFTIYSTTDSVALTNKYEREDINHISDALTLRMTEAYLNYAEALAMQDKTAEANATLQTIRKQRINYYMPEDYTGEELVNEVRLERRRELCFEGHRWFDLRRYAVATRYPYVKNIMHTFSAYSNDGAYVTSHLYWLPAGDASYTFAIPRKVIDADKVAMPQNERPDRPEYRDKSLLDIHLDSDSTDTDSTGGARSFDIYVRH